MKNWMVVANGARARVLEEMDPPGTYRHRADMVHPQTRLKGMALQSDRAGHALGPQHTPGGAAYESRTPVREREHERFAQEIAAVLDAGIASGECAGIVLVASNPFLGELRAHLGPRARQAILRTVAHDYTSLRDDEVSARLREPPPVL